jgi:hypothetical protein
MFKRSRQFIVAVLLIILLGACGAPVPPRELAPSGDLVKRAIALQLNQTEQRIWEHLGATEPELEIFGISVKLLEPIYIAKLAAYHLQGTYNLKIKLPEQKQTQKNNSFDIYLQRQIEGKTWRLLRKETDEQENKSYWTSYLVR